MTAEDNDTPSPKITDAHPMSAARARRAHRTMRILLVDDEPMVLTLLRRALRGYDTTAVTCADLARELLERERFDIVITDNKMPGPSGVELLAHVEVFHPQVRRVMFSGSPPNNLTTLSRQGIIEHFVPKVGVLSIVDLCNRLREEAEK